MDNKSLLKYFVARLEQARQALNCSRNQMAAYFGISTPTYNRYEKGRMFPGFTALHRFAKATGISLNWLACDIPPMFYEDKEKEKLSEELAEMKKSALHIQDEDLKEMLEYIKRSPLLRHELLVYFYKFKEEKDRDREQVPG